MIRVGRTIYTNGRRNDPVFPGFTPIVVLTKGTTKWGAIGPYELRDDRCRVMENVWQAAKVYASVPQSVRRYSRYDNTVIWDHPAEQHVDPNTQEPNEAYYAWRRKLENNQYSVRYPVGFNHRHQCLYALAEQPDGTYSGQLGYVDGRKQIYVPVYCQLVKQHRLFAELQQRLHNGENLLIIEVDGPHQESLPYYQAEYGVGEDFIEGNTMLVTEENIRIMLNDTKHPFGHGYCLAMVLLDKDVEWNQ